MALKHFSIPSRYDVRLSADRSWPDVLLLEIDNPQDNDVLKFDTSDWKLKNGTVTAGAHTHPQADITNLVTDLGNKSAVGHGHVKADITDFAHSHLKADITDFPHSHPQSDITSLVADLAGKAASSHSHAQSDITNLVTDLAGKAATSHAHAAGDVTSGQFPMARLASGTPDGTKFIRDDGTLQVPAGGGAATESLVAQWSQSITKTNIGASFVDIYNQANANGKALSIDTNGKTLVRIYIDWNKVGSGTQSIQVLEVGTSNVLISMDVVSGGNNSGLVDIPTALENAVKIYKLQGKSTTAADDPIFEAASITLK